jgi:hypothetical protein
MSGDDRWRVEQQLASGFAMTALARNINPEYGDYNCGATWSAGKSKGVTLIGVELEL